VDPPAGRRRILLLKVRMHPSVRRSQSEVAAADLKEVGNIFLDKHVRVELGVKP